MEEFSGYADLGDDGGKKPDFKTRQMSCFIKDLKKDDIPESLKHFDDKPKARRMTCSQMIK